MNNELAIRTPMQDTIAQAEWFVKSSFMPKHLDTVHKVYAVITLGQELGLQPWAALNNIYVIGGKPSINANLMLSLIQRSGLLDRFEVKTTDAQATVTMGRRGVGSYASTFTLEDAKRANLTTGTNSRMWQTYPKAMLKARAIADCARTLFADVLLGMYTPEELGAEVAGVTEDGAFTIVTPTPLTKDEGKRLFEKWHEKGLAGSDLREALGGGYDQWMQGYDAADARIAEWVRQRDADLPAEAEAEPAPEYSEPAL